VLGVSRRIERRFRDEPLPAIITLAVASVVVSALFVLVGEFWTSILQMIRVGSQHVGGRVARLPWKQHERQILIVGIVLFWAVVLLRRGARRGMLTSA
jgi:hydrogenase-4 membrane subunit HyfE